MLLVPSSLLLLPTPPCRFDQSRVLDSARFAQQELPKRLARRLMDLQLLPYIVVHNPNIKKVGRLGAQHVE
jgi:hypothetical protein